MRKWFAVLLAGSLLLLAGCEQLQPCGTFAFDGTEHDTAEDNGVDMSLAFDFAPEECGATCTTDLVAYVQIVRTCSFEDGTYLYPTSEKADRATEYGWYIDRLANRIWGYYGRNDDGSFAATLTPGSNTTDAVLSDRPRRGDSTRNIWWQAVTVPVCLDEDSDCLNDFLGYYFWSWIVDEQGTVPDIIHLVAWEPLEESVDEAVDKWNDQAQAPGVVKNTFPEFGRLGG